MSSPDAGALTKAGEQDPKAKWVPLSQEPSVYQLPSPSLSYRPCSNHIKVSVERDTEETGDGGGGLGWLPVLMLC